MITTRHIKAARALLAWSKGELATRSGLSEPSIARIEGADEVIDRFGSEGESLVSTLRAAGIVFLADNGEGPGVRLRTGAHDEGLRPSELTTENDD